MADNRRFTVIAARREFNAVALTNAIVGYRLLLDSTGKPVKDSTGEYIYVPV